MVRPKCSCLDPKARRRDFGNLRILPSGRHQARYLGPDGQTYNGPTTFTTHQDAEAYLRRVDADIQREVWESPRKVKAASTTFGAYAKREIRKRTLKPRTRAHYRLLLDKLILPTFAAVPVPEITKPMVDAWYYDELDESTPVLRAHAYALLKSILSAAVDDELLPVNPARIRGAGAAKATHEPRPATLDELAVIGAAMPAPYRLLVLIIAWCGLRFGEVTELRRKDIDLRNGVLHVRRGVTWVNGEPIVGPPKSKAGKRDVGIPPHLVPMIRDHLRDHAGIELLFPGPAGDHLRSSTFYGWYWPAREKAGREDLHAHDLRHTAAYLAGQTGATLRELMRRLGHATPTMAMRYQSADLERDKAIARSLSELADGDQH